MNLTSEDRRALDAWKLLSARDRRRLLRAARHGRSYPDPKVRDVAIGWALMVQRQRTPRNIRRRQWLSSVAIASVLPGTWFGSGSEYDNPGCRWIARKILEANDPGEDRSDH